MQYKKMVISVGVFVFATALLLAIGLGYIVQKKGLFEKKYHFKLEADSGADLVEGMPILFSGFEIGTVKSLKLTNKGHVEIELEIPEHQVRWVNESSTFVLDKPLIGSASIVIETKDLKAKPLSLSSVRRISTKDGINELVGKVQPVVDNLIAVLANLKAMTDQEGDMSKILHHLEVTTAKIQNTHAVEKIDDILLSLEASVNDMRTQLLDEKSGLLAKVSKSVTEDILGEHNSSLSRVNAMLDDIALKLKKLDETVDAINGISRELGGMTQDIKFTMKKSDRLIDGLNGIIGSAPKGEVTLP